MAGNVTIRMCSVNKDYPDQFSCTSAFEADVDGECLDTVLKVRNEPPREETNHLHLQKNKDADQLRGNRFTDSTIPFLSKSKISSL